jgi:hypothetical protein
MEVEAAAIRHASAGASAGQSVAREADMSPCSVHSDSFTHETQSSGGFLYDAIRLRASGISVSLGEFWDKARTDTEWAVRELLQLVALAAYPSAVAEETSCRRDIHQSLISGIGEPRDASASTAETKALVEMLTVAIAPHVSACELARSAALPPLCTAQRDGRRFAARYGSFFEQVIQSCPDVIWMDSDLLDTWVAWLGYLTESRSRTLRLAAVVAALHTVDGLLAVDRALQEQAAMLQRSVARNRSTLETIRLKTDDIQDLVKHLTQTVFSKRYRDVYAEVRAQCIEALGRWTRMAPSRFLDDRYLKYLGWMLFDKDAKVRYASLSAVSQLAQNPEWIAPMQAFLERFRARLVEMTRDREERIAILAIRLAQMLLPIDWLGKAELESVFDLITEDPRAPVRAAAGAFSIAYIELANQAYISRFGPEKASRAMLREVVFLILTAAQAPFDRICEALWNEAAIPALCDWSAYVALLEEEFVDDGSEALTDTDRRALLGFWVATTERVQHLEKTSASRRAASENALLEPSAASALLLEVGRSALPRLLRRFQSEPPMVAGLARLVRLCSEAFQNDSESIEKLLWDAFQRLAHDLEATRAITGAIYALGTVSQTDSETVPARLQELLETGCMQIAIECSESRCHQMLALLEWISPQHSGAIDRMRDAITTEIARRSAGSADVPGTVASLGCRILFLDALWRLSWLSDNTPNDQTLCVQHHLTRTCQLVLDLVQHDEDLQVVVAGMEVLLSLWTAVHARGWGLGPLVDTLESTILEKLRGLLHGRRACDSVLLALCQRIILGTLSPTLEAIPLVFLQSRASTNDAVAMAARRVHQRLRERSSMDHRIAVELAALYLGFEISGVEGTRRVASALAARYSFAAPGDGVERLLDALIDASLGFSEKVPANPAFAEAAGVALTVRLKAAVCAGAATRLLTRLEARGIDPTNATETDWWYPLWRLYQALLRDSRANIDRHQASASASRAASPDRAPASALA